MSCRPPHHYHDGFEWQSSPIVFIWEESHLTGIALNSQHGDNDVDNVDNNVDNVDNNVDNMVTMIDIYNAAPHALLVPAKVKNLIQLSFNFLNCLELSSILFSFINFSQLSKFL